MLSICIITKNEALKLEKCLHGLSEYPFEIVVVDTGSEDNSKETALKYTKHVYEFEWCDDFAEARNFAAKKAENDYILMLDTDEYADRIDVNELKKLLDTKGKWVGRIHRKNFYISNGQTMCSNELVNRIYDRRYYKYAGKIHEQIVSVNEEKAYDYQTYEAPVYTTHDGYVGNTEDRKRKADRNISILEKELEDNENDPYIIYQLGKGYYYKEDYEKAAEYWERMFEIDLNPKLEYVIDMITNYGYALLNLKNPQKALLLESVYKEFKGSADFLFMMGLVYMQNGIFKQAVDNFKAATKIPRCAVEGVNSYSAYYNIGVIYECSGNVQEAVRYYKKCGEYEPAKAGLGRCEKEGGQ